MPIDVVCDDPPHVVTVLILIRHSLREGESTKVHRTQNPAIDILRGVLMNSVDAVSQINFSSLLMNCTGLKLLNQSISFVLLLPLLNQGLGSQEAGHFNTAVIRKPLLRQVIELPLQKGCLLCGEGSQSTLVLLEHRHFNSGGLQVFHLQSIVVQHSTRGCNLFGAINRADVASVLITGNDSDRGVTNKRGSQFIFGPYWDKHIDLSDSLVVLVHLGQAQQLYRFRCISLRLAPPGLLALLLVVPRKLDLFGEAHFTRDVHRSQQVGLQFLQVFDIGICVVAGVELFLVP